MAIQPIPLNGGLDLVTSKQDAAPGTLRECLNFEVNNRRGYTKIQGIRSYDGFSFYDVGDPYILHSFTQQNPEAPIPYNTSLNEATILNGGSLDPTLIPNVRVTWGEDSSATVSFYNVGFGVSPQIAIAIVGIVGRLPVAGDIIHVPANGLGFPAEDISVKMPPVKASELFKNGSHFVLGIDDNVEDVSPIIASFDKPGQYDGLAYGVPSSVVGGVKGLAFFNKNNKLYAIGDVNAFSFTNGVLTTGQTLPTYGAPVFVTFNGFGAAVQFLFEKITVTSGSWEAGTAAGIVEMVGEQTVKAPISVGIPTFGLVNPFVLTGLVSANNAAMFAVTQNSASVLNPLNSWERQDLGFELRFNGGSNFPTVLNRAKRDIQLEAAPAEDTGWLYPSVVGVGWVNPENALGDTTGTFASQNNGSFPGPALVLTNFGAAVPLNAIVLGVEMQFMRQTTTTMSPGDIIDREIVLVGVEGSVNKKRQTLWPRDPAPAAYSESYGGSSDNWGANLSPALVNDTAFGVSIAKEFTPAAQTNDGHIHAVRIKIHYRDRSSVVYIGDAAQTAVTSITSVGAVATVTTTANHGFNSGAVFMSGAVQPEYNGTFIVTVTGDKTFQYSISGTPASPATGTINAFRNKATARMIWYTKEKGDWGTSDAEGVMTLYELSNSTDVLVGNTIRTAPDFGGTEIAVVAASPDRVYLPPSKTLVENNSQWEFAEANFYASEGSQQLFGVSGGGLAWSFDGTYFIRIRTGIEEAQDKPRHVSKHLDQLLLGYDLGTVMASDLGYPESFAGVVGGTFGGSSPISDDTITYPTFAGGAQEVPTGDAVYGLIPLAAQSTGVLCQNTLQQIVGTGGALVANLLSSNSGIIEYTLKNIGIPVYLDYRGVGSLQATDAFGDFARGRLSDSIAPWLIPRLRSSASFERNDAGPIRAEIVRWKNQYRVYFGDGYVLTMTMVGNGFDDPQFTIQKLPFVVQATASGVTTNGNDVVFICPRGVADSAGSNALISVYESNPIAFGGADNLHDRNYVYQSDVGTSWDERVPIESFIELNGIGSGREWQNRNYERVIVGGLCYGFGPFGVNYGVNFGPVETGVASNVNGGRLLAPGIDAFSEQYFSTVQNVSRDGYSLTLKFSSDGDKTYGAAVDNGTIYSFKPITIQHVAVISSDQNIRR